MPPILVEFPPSNYGALLLVGITVVESGGVDVSFWDGEYFEILFYLSSLLSKEVWFSH